MTSQQGIKILINNENIAPENYTKNIMDHEVFDDLHLNILLLYKLIYYQLLGQKNFEIVSISKIFYIEFLFNAGQVDRKIWNLVCYHNYH